MKKNNGFTLMEVMIAAMLLGLVAITASVIHISAASFLRQSSSNAKSQDEAAIIIERILRDIRRGYNATILGGGNRIIIYIDEPNLTATPWDSVLRIKYRLITSPSYELRYYPPSANNSWSGGQVISTKIISLNFSLVPNPADPNRINIRVQLTAEVEGKITSLDSTATLLYRPTQYPWEP